MLKLGSSEQWEDALEKITGTRKMSSASLVRYFKPLLDYLEEENRKNDEVIGWPDTEWVPPIGNFVLVDSFHYSIYHWVIFSLFNTQCEYCLYCLMHTAGAYLYNHAVI